MKKTGTFYILALFLLSCGRNAVLPEKSYREITCLRFEESKILCSARQNELFGVFDEKLSPDEKDGLIFLYANSPLCDLAEFDGNFFLKNVRASLEARNHYPWGKEIPASVFRHFVLPFRVNNETPDSARWVFREEIRKRIANLNMEEAALEINHWCHEKVNYQPTDDRTSGPLATVKATFGRCGEESVFTVAALRAACIPARQVYSPRWAHADDNHAWVECWINGEWKYLGACEPEPRLNMAWFTEPAKRAMLVTTTVLGQYSGSEEVINKGTSWTLINTLPVYAETSRLLVKLVDEENNPQPQSKVKFSLFNYAEFYPLAELQSDLNGEVNFLTGKGSLLVEAENMEYYGFRFMNVADSDSIVIVLKKNGLPPKPKQLHHSPPPAPVSSQVDAAGREENLLRIQAEDSIRNEGRSRFTDPALLLKFKDLYGSNSSRYLEIIRKSGANSGNIMSWLIENLKQENHCYHLLSGLSEKDLRDIDIDVLNDNLNHFRTNLKFLDYNAEIIYPALLCPRIKNEHLLPYKNLLAGYFEELYKLPVEERVKAVVSWISDSIKLRDEENYYLKLIPPAGTFSLRVSDRASRDLFLVALCRSLGIPSRLNPGNGFPEVYISGTWLHVNPEEQSTKAFSTGKISFQKPAAKPWFDPVYGIHFSLSKIEGRTFRRFETLTDKRLSEIPEFTDIREGDYRLLKCIRQNDGSVDIVNEYFHISEGEKLSLDMSFPDFFKSSAVHGKVINKQLNFAKAGGTGSLSLPDKSSPAVLIWLEPGREPTDHLCRELSALSACYETWTGKVYLVYQDGNGNPDTFHPAGSTNAYEILTDPGFEVLNSISETLFNGRIPEKPVVMIVEREGFIPFISEGYRVGLGDLILFNLE